MNTGFSHLQKFSENIHCVIEPPFEILIRFRQVEHNRNRSASSVPEAPDAKSHLQTETH
jgi:hypothetical protein